MLSLLKRARWLVLACAALCGALGPSRALAQPPPPRIMVVIDTSASMARDVNGTPTYGDGTGNVTGTNDCGTPAGRDTNCNGEPDDSRIYEVETAVSEVVAAFGDVDWALASFGATRGPSAYCSRVEDYECVASGVGSFGNPVCNTGTVITPCGEAGIPAGCRPTIHRFGVGTGLCIPWAGTCTAGQRLVDWSTTGTDRRAAVLRWMDHRETMFDASTTAGDVCSHVSLGRDCELHPTGGTPMVATLSMIRTYVTGLVTADPMRGCRQNAIIWIGDGLAGTSCASPPASETQANAVAEINNLYGAALGTAHVFMIGYGLAMADRASFDALASAGRTGTGQYPADLTSLRAAVGAAVAATRLTLVETCNGLDDDCDIRIDEDFAMGAMPVGGMCSAGVGACRVSGTNVCNPDHLGSHCTATAGSPSTEICNGVDDNCNGLIDDGAGCFTCFPQAEICNNTDDDCNARIDDNPIDSPRPCGSNVGECRSGYQSCIAGTFGICTDVRPGTESCNNRDDDCDGIVDRIRRPCGAMLGMCASGSQLCVDGVWGTCDGTSGTIDERCDGIDNDCDGAFDEDTTRPCGSDVGECVAGVQTCTAASWSACVGETSGGTETCNGLDDDCNGVVDDGVQRHCGVDTGACAFGVQRCVEGGAGDWGTCGGGVGPMPEVCDGVDQDCDTMIDETLTRACGTDEGECTAGTEECLDGRWARCDAVRPTPERCDGLDQDCDALVDEMVGLEVACGTDIGHCYHGHFACLAGAMSCVDAVIATAEICDCEDDDCDGMVDETSGGALCPSGQTCAGCRCAMPCAGASCPAGQEQVHDASGACFCAPSPCDSERCAEESHTTPAGTCGASGVACVCRGNTCTHPCDGVVCDVGTTCDPNDARGRCVEPNCRGLGCPSGQICDVRTATCNRDACLGITCAPNEACRAGTCEPSCGSLRCSSGERCENAHCVPDACAHASCVAGQFCSQSTGNCVTDRCGGVACPRHTTCDRTTGGCIADACETLRCPIGERCISGDCRSATGMDGGVATTPVEGGCGCRASRATSSATGLGWVGVLMALLSARRLGRKRCAATR